MSVTFTKLFSSITESTIWCESAPTRLTWITMLAMADRKGRIWASIPGLAHRARVTVDECQEAIRRFLSPDEHSRTPDNEGRRIEPIDGGWRLLNYQKYRDIKDEEGRRESKRDWIANRRAAEKMSTRVDNVDRSRPRSTQAEAEAEAEADKNKNKTSMSSSSTVQGLFEHWKTTFKHPKATLDKKRAKAISEALKNYSEEDLRNSLTGYTHSPHHMGKNDRNTVYDEITLLLKDSAHVDAGLKFFANPPKPPEPRPTIVNGQVLMSPEQLEARKMEKQLERKPKLGIGHGFTLADFRGPNEGESADQYRMALDVEFDRRLTIINNRRRAEALSQREQETQS